MKMRVAYVKYSVVRKYISNLQEFTRVTWKVEREWSFSNKMDRECYCPYNFRWNAQYSSTSATLLLYLGSF